MGAKFGCPIEPREGTKRERMERNSSTSTKKIETKKELLSMRLEMEKIKLERERLRIEAAKLRLSVGLPEVDESNMED